MYPPFHYNVKEPSRLLSFEGRNPSIKVLFLAWPMKVEKKQKAFSLAIPIILVIFGGTPEYTLLVSFFL